MKLMAAAIAATAALALAAPAGATTIADEICNTLDQEPNSAGVTIVGMSLLEAGATPQQAAELIVAAVKTTCPQHVVALEDFMSRERKPSFT